MTARTRRSVTVAALCSLVALGSCAAFSSASGGTTSVAQPATPPFSKAARQTVLRFFAAYNGHHPEQALSFFTSSTSALRFVGGSDCDYRDAHAFTFRGRAGVRTWLRTRSRDHDVLEVASITIRGTVGAVVEYTRRRSDTLRAAGFRDGVVPKTATKIGFARGSIPRFTQFANAQGDASCVP